MKKTITVFCKQISMGGAETLILRLLQWYRNNNYRTILLTLDEITNKSILEDFNKIDFEHYVYDLEKKNFFSKEFMKLSFNEEEQPLIITQSFLAFFKCFSLLRKSKYKCHFRHTIYIVHPYSTFISKKIAFLGKKLIDILLLKNMLVFMDEACVKGCKLYYQLPEDKYEFSIYRLPILIRQERTDLKICKNNIINILTISRLEFPFKGYIIGLIKSYVKLYGNNKNISLTIIGYGENREQIIELTKTIPPKITATISILDQVPYGEINDYIEKCDVYVGMGTTILDAANMNKIGILAVAYQMSDFSSGFFHEKNSLGEIFDKDLEYRDFTNLILKIINSNEKEFFAMSIKSKDVLKEYYNIDTIANRLGAHTKKYFTLSDSIFIHMIITMNNISGFIGNIIRAISQYWNYLKTKKYSA